MRFAKCKKRKEYTQTVQHSAVQCSTTLLNIAKHVKIYQFKKYLELTDYVQRCFVLKVNILQTEAERLSMKKCP